MRRALLSHFLVATLLSSCAYEGVIVEKRFRPLPFPDSLGVDAIYNFQLRDSVGQIHSQMVTADVFANYRVGDYFNDLQTPPSHGDKQMKGFRPTPLEMNEGPYQPVRVMQIQPQSSNQTVKATTRVHHHTKRTSKITKSKQHAKKHAKTARKHRKPHRKTLASAR
jgi:hypothetical protein